MVAVCIVSNKAIERKVIDPAVLQRVGGYKVNVTHTCAADLIVSKSGSTAAFLFIEDAAPLAADGSEIWHRYGASPQVIILPTAIDFAMTALKLSEALIRAPQAMMPAEAAEAVQDMAAVRRALMSMPGAHLSQHHASALCMLGSLQHIASSSIEDILDKTHLTPAQAQRIVDFFAE